MKETELKRCLELFVYFDVEQDNEFIYLTDGGNSCIMNMKTQWQEFLVCSINSIAIAVAKELNKKIKWK
jgi:hypothetical protein